MSAENAAVVRRLYAQWGEGNYDDSEPFDAELDFEMSGWVLLTSEPIRARGIDAMTEVWRETLKGWDHLRTGPIEELIEVGDQIVVMTRLVARGKHAGIEVDAPRGAVFTFRGGKITRLLLGDREEALREAGLPGSGQSF